MTALVLTNYMSLGEQESSGVFIDSTGNTPGVSGALSMEDASLISVSNAGVPAPQGERFYIKIVYADQTNVLLQPVFEIMEASYDLDNGVYKWNRELTLASSNNGAAVDFQSAVGQPNLKIFGVIPDALLGTIKQKESDSRILSESFFDPGGTLTLPSGSADIRFSASPEFFITPNSSTSVLRICGGGYCEIEKNTDNKYGHYIYLQYNDGSQWVDRARIFYNLATTAVESISRMEAGFRPSTLTQSHLNSNGDWQFRYSQSTPYSLNDGRVSFPTAMCFELG